MHQPKVIGKDCRIDGVDYLLARLCYAHPEMMPAGLVRTVKTEILDSVSRQELIEISIEQIRREKIRLGEEDAANRENLADKKFREIKERTNAALTTRIYNAEKLRDAVCAYYGISTVDICSPIRTDALSYPRQIFFYLARHLSEHKISYPVIAKMAGCKNHTSVVKAYNKMKRLIEEDSDVASEVTAIVSSLKKAKRAA